MENLKPCPFCGSKAQMDYIDDGNNGWWYSVVCMKPMCRCGVSNTDYSYFNAEDATEAWNRRAGEEVKDITIKKVKGFSSVYPSICNLKLLPSIDGTWITIQDDVGTSMTIKLSDLSDFICLKGVDKTENE